MYVCNANVYYRVCVCFAQYLLGCMCILQPGSVVSAYNIQVCCLLCCVFVLVLCLYCIIFAIFFCYVGCVEQTLSLILSSVTD